MKTTLSLATFLILFVQGSFADAANISAGKSYSYSDVSQVGITGFYEDDPFVDSTIGDGIFFAGELTDGTNGGGNATDANQPSSVVGLMDDNLGGGTGIHDIVIDLAGTYSISDINIGTSVRNNNGTFGGFAPTDVTIAFSDDNITYGVGTNYALFAGALPDGHSDIAVAASTAVTRFVKLTFDVSNTNNRFMLDEIVINGDVASTVPEPGSIFLSALAVIGIGLFQFVRQTHKQRAS